MALEDLYKEIILDHYRRPRHHGVVGSQKALHARGYNPLCGDEIEVTARVENGKIVELAFDGKGCAISQASASMMTEVAFDQWVSDFEDRFASFRSMLDIDQTGAEFDNDMDAGAQLGDAESLQSVKQFPARIKCATLGWNTLEKALHGSETFTER